MSSNFMLLGVSEMQNTSTQHISTEHGLVYQVFKIRMNEGPVVRRNFRIMRLEVRQTSRHITIRSLNYTVMLFRLSNWGGGGRFVGYRVGKR